MFGALLDARATNDGKLSADELVGNLIADFTPALFAGSLGHCRQNREMTVEGVETGDDEAAASSENFKVDKRPSAYSAARLRFAANADKLIRLTVEGEFFNFGSLATINRKIVLLFMRHSRQFHVRIKSYHKVLASKFICLETLILFSMYMKQKREGNAVGHDLIRRKVLFRNRWKLSMRSPPNGTLLIEQQPLDYHAMPKVCVQINCLLVNKYRKCGLFCPTGAFCYISDKGLCIRKSHTLNIAKR